MCNTPTGECACPTGTVGNWPDCSEAPPDTANFCTVPVTDWKQTQSPWGGLLYAGLPNLYFSRKGCAVTSLTIVLAAGGLLVDPGVAHARMLQSRDAFLGTAVNWMPAVQAISQNTFVWQDFQLVGAGSRDSIAASVCRGRPFIVKVPSAAGHFVVVNRAPRSGASDSALGAFGISDPGSLTRSTLSSYGQIVGLRGSVRPSAVSPAAMQGGMRGLFAQIGTGERLSLHGAGLYFVVTDALGRRVGKMGADSAAFDEIPGGAFDDDVDTDDHADTLGTPAPMRRVFEVLLPVEASQTLTIRAMADTTLPAPIAFLAVTRENARWPKQVNVFPLAIAKGQRLSWRLIYDADTSHAMSLERTDAAAAKPYQLTAMCGTRFRVRNRIDREIAATWDVYGMSESGTLTLPARSGANPNPLEYADVFFETSHRGTVRLFVDGKQADVKAPSANGCAP